MPFGLQPIHIIIIVAVALIIFGPSKLPEMGRSLGKAITEFRRGTQEMAEGFKEEVIKPVEHTSQPEPAGISLTQAPTQLASSQLASTPITPAQATPAPMAATPIAAMPNLAPPILAPQACPQCHAENPASARFCNSCGAVLAAQPN